MSSEFSDSPVQLPTQKASKRWVHWLWFVATVVFLLWIILPAFAKARVAAIRTSDIIALKDITSALLVYVADENDRCPPAKDWGSSLHAYLKKPITLYKSVSPNVCFAYNGALSGEKPSEFEDPSSTVSFFLANLKGPSAVGGKSDLATVDYGTHIVAFLDGRAKHLMIEKADTLTWGKIKAPTKFSIR